MNEKIKVKNKEYALLGNGVSVQDTIAQFKLVDVSDTVEDVEAAFEGADSVKVLNETDEVLAVYNGFSHVTYVTKENDVVIGSAVDENEEQEVATGTVITVTLKKPSMIEHELEHMQAEIEYLAMMADIDLEEE